MEIEYNREQKETTPPARGEPHRPKNWKWIRIRTFIISSADKFPPLGRLLRYLYKIMKIATYKWYKRGLVLSIDNDRIQWVKPEKIAYSSLEEFRVYEDKGRVADGDWDKLKIKFDELDVCIAFRERFIEAKDWQDTHYYQLVLNDIKNGKFVWQCKNKSDLDKRFALFDSLFQNIKKNGYIPQSQILAGNNTNDPIRAEDEITVNIGRDGDLLFNNGAHRLTMTKLLGIEEIPVKITVRHPQWLDFKRQVLHFAQDQPGGYIYQPLTHPDLQDVPSFHDAESERFKIIKNNLGIKTGRLLDIGAHWGYFCHKFEEIGFNCYAVENDRLHIYFMEKLKRAENRHFQVVPESIFEYRAINDSHFDVVLALNIFHHFLKHKDTYEKLIRLLNALNTKELFFQPHHVNEPQWGNAYINYTEEAFVEFVLKNSQLNNASFLGRAPDGRGIYKLY